jgi:hypothetical protein
MRCGRHPKALSRGMPAIRPVNETQGRSVRLCCGAPPVFSGEMMVCESSIVDAILPFAVR